MLYQLSYRPGGYCRKVCSLNITQLLADQRPRAVFNADLGKLLMPASVHPMGISMKRVLLTSFAVFLLSSCTPSDQERANEKAREAGREIKREAEHASEQMKRGVEELDRKAGPKLDQAGREIKEESHRVVEKARERAERIQGKPRSNEPPPER